MGPILLMWSAGEGLLRRLRDDTRALVAERPWSVPAADLLASALLYLRATWAGDLVELPPRITDLEERVDPKHSVLMVIDVQNDFCHQDGSPGRRGADVPFIQAAVPNMQSLIEIGRASCRERVYGLV